NLLIWANEHAFPLVQLRDGKDACEAAARGGHLAVLQWLREQKCRWSTSTCESAAESGHLAVLQWAHERGCPLGDAAAYAARGGHLHVLQWLRSQGCEWDSWVTLGAARAGHRE